MPRIKKQAAGSEGAAREGKAKVRATCELACNYLLYCDVPLT
jgi:hypothetical protein